MMTSAFIVLMFYRDKNKTKQNKNAVLRLVRWIHG